jgi:hypothetical protein
MQSILLTVNSVLAAIHLNVDGQLFIVRAIYRKQAMMMQIQHPTHTQQISQHIFYIPRLHRHTRVTYFNVAFMVMIYIQYTTTPKKSTANPTACLKLDKF